MTSAPLVLRHLEAIEREREEQDERRHEKPDEAAGEQPSAGAPFLPIEIGAGPGGEKVRAVEEHEPGEPDGHHVEAENGVQGEHAVPGGGAADEPGEVEVRADNPAHRDVAQP